MSSVVLGGIVFLCLFGATLIGMLLRSRLPDHHLSVESKGNYIYSPKKFVALIGVEDLVVVETEDAILIADRRHSQDVGKVVKELASSGRKELI